MHDMIMQNHIRTFAVQLGLIFAVVSLYPFHQSIASPLSVINSPRSLVSLSILTNPNTTTGYLPTQQTLKPGTNS